MERMANQAGRDDTGDMEDLQDSPASPTREAGNDSNSGSGIGGQGGGSGVGDDNEADVVHFSDNNFKDGRVFKLSSGSEKQIEFDRTDDDADLKDIKWHVKTKKNETLGSAKFEDSRPDRQFIDCAFSRHTFYIFMITNTSLSQLQILL
jgi:hypothetical protein